MIRAIAFIASTCPALADPLSISGTIITMDPADPPAVARITMDNRAVNQGSDEGDYALTMPGLSVPIEFDWDVQATIGADAITITPPDGTYCEPRSCVLQLNEGEAGELWIMEWVGF